MMITAALALGAARPCGRGAASGTLSALRLEPVAMSAGAELIYA
jgi:hypothetical protein